MSAFKRYQSKVFWDHMASKDFENLNNLPATREAPRMTQNFRNYDQEIPQAPRVAQNFKNYDEELPEVSKIGQNFRNRDIELPEAPRVAQNFRNYDQELPEAPRVAQNFRNYDQELPEVSKIGQNFRNRDIELPEAPRVAQNFRNYDQEIPQAARKTQNFQNYNQEIPEVPKIGQNFRNRDIELPEAPRVAQNFRNYDQELPEVRRAAQNFRNYDQELPEVSRMGQNFRNCDIELPEEKVDEASSINESDTIDGGNVTAIRVCPSESENRRSLISSVPICNENALTRGDTTEIENAAKDVRDNVVLEDRSCSPLSQDLRSQDSGFSDSERSNCSEAYENETPRRRRRRKKIGDRQSKMHPRMGALWLEDGVLPNPTYTSTPKDSRIPKRNSGLYDAAAERNISRIRRNDEDETDASAAPVSVSLREECLGDFLYAAEPPEDAVEPRSISSSITTNSSESQSVCKSILNSRNYRQSSSVRGWLNDLAMETENECGSTLQSKALPQRKTRGIVSEKDEMNDLKILSSLATAAASKLLVRAEQFDRHYRYIVDKVSHLEGGRSEKELLRAIEEDAFSILSELGAPPPRRIHQTTLKGILSQLDVMKNYVDGAIDTRLDFYIERVVRGLEEAPKDDTTVARGTLAALTALGLAGSRAGSSIARCSGIRALLTSLITAGRTSTDFVAASLRALASVCCSAIAIDVFAKDGGPEILTDLLIADTTTEKEKMEATALVVQITAPWMNALGLPYIEPFAESLIPVLNRLVEHTSCGQTLLLVAAALNHLSKSRKCASVILQHDTVKTLLRSVKKSTGRNVWLMEQVASLISELARIPEARPHLAKARASVALVSFLRMRPPGLEDAYRRLEITAAAALTRLCVDPEIARQVVAVGGADCLPSCEVNDLADDDEQVEAGLLKYTKSLRRACKKAAKQIDMAKASDYSMLS